MNAIIGMVNLALEYINNQKIVKTLVEMRGGSITVESGKGKGTKFTLFLKYKLTEQKNVPKVHQTVSISDINLNGKIAMEKYMHSENGDIDFIFMDIQIPVMNGFEATKAIRRSKKASGKSIPIIAMTANAFSEDIQNCLKAGMNAHIAKPVSLENISNTLKKLAIIK